MINIALNGLADTLKDLGAYPADIDAALVNSLNRGATYGRQQITQKILVTGISRQIINQHIAIHRAKQSNPVATINPSSAGIPVENYKFSLEPLAGEPTRARIMVAWVTGGQKVAAGFMNPKAKSGTPKPLSTRSSKGTTTPTSAIGPSIAAGFKIVADDQLLADIGLNVEQYFMESINKRIASRQPISVEG